MYPQSSPMQTVPASTLNALDAQNQQLRPRLQTEKSHGKQRSYVDELIIRCDRAVAERSGPYISSNSPVTSDNELISCMLVFVCQLAADPLTLIMSRIQMAARGATAKIVRAIDRLT